jgi:hypothetical protein
MQEFELDTILLEFPNKGLPNTEWTIRDAVEGVQIFGGIGSGKTTGSGRLLALKYLKAGFGGLVLTAKPDEKQLWEQYCELAGRSQDLIIVEPKGKEFFDFISYEAQSSDGEVSYTENILQVLKTVIKASDEKEKGQSNDAFWDAALDMLIANTIDLCLLAYGKISVELMYDIVQTAPSQKSKDGGEEFAKAFKKVRQNVFDSIDSWRQSLPKEKAEKYEGKPPHDPELYNDAYSFVPEIRSMEYVYQFFFETYQRLADKTRSIVDFSFSGFLFRLLKDPVYSLFCKNKSTFSPQSSLEGKIIVINVPVKKFHKVGRDIQIMFKYIWQRSMEKRDITKNERPVFLWADESQNFIHEYDAEYQATARSSRIATVYLSQNMPNYFANMGGQKSEYRVKSFLGTLSTKIFHANGDVETNKYASELIGESYRESVTKTTSVQAGAVSESTATTLTLDKPVRAEHFSGLKNGSPKNKFTVEAIIHRQGNTFSDGLSYQKVRFNQKYKP